MRTTYLKISPSFIYGNLKMRFDITILLLKKSRCFLEKRRSENRPTLVDSVFFYNKGLIVSLVIKLYIYSLTHLSSEYSTKLFSYVTVIFKNMKKLQNCNSLPGLKKLDSTILWLWLFCFFPKEPKLAILWFWNIKKGLFFWVWLFQNWIPIPLMKKVWL